MRGLAERYGWTAEQILELTPEAAQMFLGGDDPYSNTRTMSAAEYRAMRRAMTT
jgi:hypothetical protein